MICRCRLITTRNTEFGKARGGLEISLRKKTIPQPVSTSLHLILRKYGLNSPTNGREYLLIQRSYSLRHNASQ